jgi:hypothetical protein
MQQQAGSRAAAICRYVARMPQAGAAEMTYMSYAPEKQENSSVHARSSGIPAVYKGATPRAPVPPFVRCQQKKQSGGRQAGRFSAMLACSVAPPRLPIIHAQSVPLIRTSPAARPSRPEYPTARYEPSHR